MEFFRSHLSVSYNKSMTDADDQCLLLDHHLDYCNCARRRGELIECRARVKSLDTLYLAKARYRWEQKDGE
jgi:hypothetical protein